MPSAAPMEMNLPNGRSSPSDAINTPRRWRRLAQNTVLNAAEQILGTESPKRLSVMIFHRVLPEADPFLSGDTTADEFTAVMTVVREHFNPIPLSEGVRRLQDGTLPPRAVCVTFDDGYADNLLVAAPILTLMHRGRQAPPMMKDNGGAVALGRGRDIF